MRGDLQAIRQSQQDRGRMSRELLKRARARVTVDIDGVTVFLRAPSAGDWLEYQSFIGTLPEQSYEHIPRLLAITVVDEDGKPTLSETDIRALDMRTVTTLFREAIALVRVESEVATKQGESSRSR